MHRFSIDYGKSNLFILAQIDILLQHQASLPKGINGGRGPPFWQKSSFTLPLLEDCCIEAFIWVCHNHYFANQCWQWQCNLISLNNTLNMIFFSNWMKYFLVEKSPSIL